MLRACALEWYGNWDDYLPLVEFAYNNSWQSSIGMAPFEALYGRKCRIPICWNEVGEKVLEGPDLVQVTADKVAFARERLEQARSRQKSYADKGRREYEFKAGDKVFLKVSPQRGIQRFDQKDAFREDLSCEEEAEAILAREDRVLRKNTIPFINILWKNHDIRESTWETEDSVRERYSYLFESDGGIDVIETYVFWNVHEPSPGNYNFEGRYDLVRFLKTVQKAGLYANLRVGPYICAEWNFGGFPVWLKYVPGISFRTDNEPFKVFRDGRWNEEDDAVLVPGDIISIKSGDIVPADARLLEDDPLKIDQDPAVFKIDMLVHFCKEIIVITDERNSVFAKGIDADAVVLMAARASRTENQDAIDNAIVGMLADPKEVGVQTSKMEMLPSNVDINSWETYNEDISSMKDSSAFTTSGLLEQINVTRVASDYLWYITR
ncbi:hypothetical protein AgCh_022899 [Apium graveolens]